MFSKLSALITMLQTNSLTVTSSQNGQKPKFAILPERVAIVTCGLLVAVFAIPLLVVIQALAGLVGGITTVFQLLQGKLNEDDEF